jgi:hypothetical protein
MLTQLYDILVIILVIYAAVISVLYWKEKQDKDNFMKEKEVKLNKKETELQEKELVVIDKETCTKELSRVKSLQESAVDILKTAYQNIK